MTSSTLLVQIQVQRFDKLFLKEYDEEINGDIEIFRLSAFLPIVIVGDTIKETLSKYSGFVMYKPDEYPISCDQP